jgi:hypothetical protein
MRHKHQYTPGAPHASFSYELRGRGTRFFTCGSRGNLTIKGATLELGDFETSSVSLCEQYCRGSSCCRARGAGAGAPQARRRHRNWPCRPAALRAGGHCAAAAGQNGFATKQRSNEPRNQAHNGGVCIATQARQLRRNAGPPALTAPRTAHAGPSARTRRCSSARLRRCCN